MPKKKAPNSNNPTLSDVAKLAGVSQSTVSRVLNESNLLIPISDKTKSRVLDAVKKLGYQPNILARSLRTQKTQMIAVMIGDISNAFYHPIVRTVQDVAQNYDYDVLIFNGDHIYKNEKRFLQSLLRRPVDGVIMAPHRLSTEDIEDFIQRSGIPLVAIGAQVQHPLVDVVGGTSEAATYEAISWLIHEKGHQEIGFMGVKDDMPPGPARLAGYRRALQNAQIPVNFEYIQKADFTLQGGRDAMQAFISQKSLPTAIFASNSLMAIGAIKVAQAQGYTIPEDFSIMGFDDIPEATIVSPSLTVVSRNLPKIGIQVAELLFERIENKVELGGRFFQGTWELLERESTRHLK
jgi:LacI family transcriptional regulator